VPIGSPQAVEVLVRRKTRTIGGDLKQNAVRDAEVDRAEVIAIDERDARNPLRDHTFVPITLFRFICYAKGNVMDAPGPKPRHRFVRGSSTTHNSASRARPRQFRTRALLHRQDIEPDQSAEMQALPSGLDRSNPAGE